MLGTAVKKTASAICMLSIFLVSIFQFSNLATANPIIPPYVHIQSPQNKIYSSNEIELNFAAPSVELPENTYFTLFSYRLDNFAVVTIDGNLTLTSLPWGSHSIIVYAQDNEGLLYFSQTVHFDVIFSTAWVLAAFIIAAFVCVGLLVYLKKYKRGLPK